jgi:hypothetical protein
MVTKILMLAAISKGTLSRLTTCARALFLLVVLDIGY